MSDETPGAGQGALPPREGQSLRPLVERPAVTTSATMRLAHVVGGQYVLTTQSHGMPSLTQINPGNLTGNTNLAQTGITRIISISPSRVSQTTSVRPSLANQSIVNVLTKPRTNTNVRLQLFQSGDGSASNVQHPVHQRPVKRPVSTVVERKDSYASKLQHVMNHRIVRSKLIKEKYNEHLLEAYYLETGNNILDLHQFAKRPKTQAYLAYLKEHAVDPQDRQEVNSLSVPQTTPSTPSATSASSLPGISHTPSTPTVSALDNNVSTPKSFSVNKTKTPISSTVSSQDLIVEKAKQEAYVVQRVADLQKEGLWSEKRLPKVQEMHRAKAHWDFLLEEMVWLAADFAQERKWKKAAAKKCARMVQKHFQDKAMAAQKAEKAHEQNLRRIAGFCAKEVKIFWSNVEKLVEFKQNTILEEKRKRALDQQLSFIVDQTEKYSQLLAEGMNKTADLPAGSASSRGVSRAPSDTEFHPDLHSDDDDEETIEQEEAEGNEGHKEEVEALRKESQMDLDDLLEDDSLRNYLLHRDKIRLSESEDSDDDQNDESKKETVVDDQTVSEAEDSDSKDEDEDSEEESEGETVKTDVVRQDDHNELKLLVEDSHKEGEEKKTEEDNKDKIIDDAAAIAESIQPKGNTLSSTNVSTNIPFLLKFSLREYQHIGLDWLVTMYERKLNGILADEMGLGKTIQTIALLAHLACEKENWGPHLIVVPTSVMLNWEMECKKWCPAFKILTYYGSQKERKLKRTGWTKPNAFHICITSYKLVIQDHQSFRRKKWKYLILDEAQNIKNFKSQRWQLLLNFQTQQRLLLTGTPLQNNLMELWSLMHFLMPNVFQSHREFKEWFSNPVTGMIEGNSEYNENIIKRLHKVLRPFLLRRLKSEVEKQMPKKYEHVVVCRLSKRQRYLYDDYMSRAKTRETLVSGNMLSVINVLMQLRKVCNHPNLFEVRPTISPFQCEGITLHIPSIVYSALDYDPDKHVNLEALNLLLIMQEIHYGSYQCYRMRQSRHSRKIIELDQRIQSRPPPCKLAMRVLPVKTAPPPPRGKVERKEVTVSQPPPLQFKGLTPQNVKVKVAGMQLLNQQGILKTIPVVNISQGATGQIGTPVNVTSLLKPADKISASFAQLVQTSTGKHLLLTSNPNITANIPVTSTPGGQKLTFLSKQPVSTIGNTGHAVTKAFVKFQLTSVTTGTTISTVTTNSSAASVAKSDDKVKTSRTKIGNDYLGKLYSKQNSLDVRWQNEDKTTGFLNEEDPKGERRSRLMLMASINKRRCSALPLYGRDFQDAVKIFSPNKIDPWQGGAIHCLNTLYNKTVVETTSCLSDMLHNPERRIESLKDICDRFIFYVPAVKSSEASLRVWHPPPGKYWGERERAARLRRLFSKPATALHRLASATVTQFPDPRLIQYDCGKLQTMDRLLRRLKAGGHRVLVFTQMTRMLDVLEAFLNFHGHIYLRLDGTTKVDQRQVLMERFNGDKRIFAFILSTRSGGVGVNLTGADTVIFYDSDWNPTMDAQAQDRCHRIGQTRDVHIYRLVSERTIEENILKKANQKRLLGDLAIEGGNFTTAFFKSSTIQDLFNVDQTDDDSRLVADAPETKPNRGERTNGEGATAQGDEKTALGALESALAACEDDQDVQAARTAKAEAVADLAEFDENIPLDEQEREPEMSKAEAEINNIIEKLSPIEKYAMKFIETTESAWSAEQLAAAEREIEQQKREWEENRLAAMREEEERRVRELEEDGELITFSREDATNQVSGKTTKKWSRRRVSGRGGGGARRSRSVKAAKVDSDGGSSTSGESENLSSRLVSNSVDKNSPRTRSRGTVAINLWTLDVSPILPGEKPIRRQARHIDGESEDDKPVVKRRKSASEDESCPSDDRTPKLFSKRRRMGRKKVKNSCAIGGKGKICKVVLNDIVAEGQYKIPAEVGHEMEIANSIEEETNDTLSLVTPTEQDDSVASEETGSEMNLDPMNLEDFPSDVSKHVTLESSSRDIALNGYDETEEQLHVNESCVENSVTNDLKDEGENEHVGNETITAGESTVGKENEKCSVTKYLNDSSQDDELGDLKGISARNTLTEKSNEGCPPTEYLKDVPDIRDDTLEGEVKSVNDISIEESNEECPPESSKDDPRDIPDDILEGEKIPLEDSTIVESIEECPATSDIALMDYSTEEQCVNECPSTTESLKDNSLDYPKDTPQITSGNIDLKAQTTEEQCDSKNLPSGGEFSGQYPSMLAESEDIPDGTLEIIAENIDLKEHPIEEHCGDENVTSGAEFFEYLEDASHDIPIKSLEITLENIDMKEQPIEERSCGVTAQTLSETIEECPLTSTEYLKDISQDNPEDTLDIIPENIEMKKESAEEQKSIEKVDVETTEKCPPSLTEYSKDASQDIPEENLEIIPENIEMKKPFEEQSTSKNDPSVGETTKECPLTTECSNTMVLPEDAIGNNSLKEQLTEEQRVNEKTTDLENTSGDINLEREIPETHLESDRNSTNDLSINEIDSMVDLKAGQSESSENTQGNFNLAKISNIPRQETGTAESISQPDELEAPLHDSLNSINDVDPHMNRSEELPSVSTDNKHEINNKSDEITKSVTDLDGNVHNKIKDKSSHRDNGLGEFQKISTIVNNRKNSFRSPDSRKKSYRFNRFSNNMTLDGWVKKTPLKKRNDNASFSSTSKSLHGPP